MRLFLSAMLFVTALLAALLGAGFISDAKSAIHEIEGFICVLIAVAGFGACAIVMAIEKLRTDTLDALDRDATEARAVRRLARQREGAE
jgi:4-hydroxybenzoate polyprenyltransferase